MSVGPSGRVAPSKRMPARSSSRSPRRKPPTNGREDEARALVDGAKPSSRLRLGFLRPDKKSVLAVPDFVFERFALNPVRNPVILHAWRPPADVRTAEMLANLLAAFCRDVALDHATKVPSKNEPPNNYEIHLFLSSPSTTFSGTLIARGSARERFAGWSWDFHLGDATLSSSGGASSAELRLHPATKRGALVDLESAMRALFSSDAPRLHVDADVLWSRECEQLYPLSRLGETAGSYSVVASERHVNFMELTLVAYAHND